MALASQTSRTQEVVRGSRGGYQSPRRKKKRTTLMILGAIVLIAGGYVAYRQFGGKGAPKHSGSQASNTPSPASATPPASPRDPLPQPINVPVPLTKAPVPLTKAPEPVAQPDVLTMGDTKVEEASKREPAPIAGVKDPLGAPEAGSPSSTPASLPATPPAPAPSVSDMPADAAAAIDRAKRAMGENKLVEARGLLNSVLANPNVKEAEKEGVRTWLSEINQTLVFSPTVAPNDPLTEAYKVVSGDSLERITKKRGLAVDRRLIARVNRMANPDVLRLGQSIKLVHGPFHAVVHKSRFRLDLYAGTPLPPGSAGTPRADGSEEGWTYIRSFPVGLGENNGTPVGTFVVKRNSKLTNPHWVNPRTGEKFDANDPKNPIGEHWLGLTGVDEKTKSVSGYGLHGTIDPDSIGKERSMGCVRLRADDIAIVWEMLVDEVSTVRIVE